MVFISDNDTGNYVAIKAVSVAQEYPPCASHMLRASPATEASIYVLDALGYVRGIIVYDNQSRHNDFHYVL